MAAPIRRILELALLIGFLASFPAWAVSAHQPKVPARGLTMKQVQARFGHPRHRHPPVGHPPITRWDYPGFVVVFEYNIVQHTVIPDAPPPVYHRSFLRRVPAENASTPR